MTRQSSDALTWEAAKVPEINSALRLSQDGAARSNFSAILDWGECSSVVWLSGMIFL